MADRRQDETQIKGWKRVTSLAARASIDRLEVMDLMAEVEDVKATVLEREGADRREKEIQW